MKLLGGTSVTEGEAVRVRALATAVAAERRPRQRTLSGDPAYAARLKAAFTKLRQTRRRHTLIPG